MVSTDYVVGLTDGEGCFYVNIRDRLPGKWIPKVETHFYIKLTADHKDLLEEVKACFGCGAIYYQKENRPNHSPCYRFEINSKRDINEVLIPFFNKNYLRGPKKKDFSLFSQIVKLVNSNKHQTDAGVTRIRQLKSEMNHGARWMRESRSSSGNAK